MKTGRGGARSAALRAALQPLTRLPPAVLGPLRSVPTSTLATATALCPAVRSLRRSAAAALSSSAPVRPPLALRAVACRSAIQAAWQRSRPGSSLALAPRPAGETEVTSAGPARCAGPRRNTPAGPPAKPPADPAGRLAGRRERKQSPQARRTGATEPLHRATCRHSPGRVGIRRSCPAAAAPVPPRGHQRRVSTLRPPFPPSPPSHLNGVAVKRWAAIEIRGEGRTTGALREGLPPKPPAKVRPNKLGGTRPRQGPSLAGRQLGGGGRRPGSA